MTTFTDLFFIFFGLGSIIFACIVAALRTKPEPDREILFFDPTPPARPPEAPKSSVAPSLPPETAQVPTTVPESEEGPSGLSKRERLYEAAFSCLGSDMSPKENELGCAESLYFVMKKAGVPGLPAKPIYSTIVFDEWLREHFERVDEPEPGDIVMSATASGNGTVKHGHVGVVGKHSIMSNNSATFMWDYHLTLAWWRDYYGRKGAMPVKFYRWA